MRLRAVTLLASIVCSLLASPARAQKSPSLAPFLGVWKEDESKRNLAGVPPLVFRQGSTGIEELRGDEVSASVQPVAFDGHSHVVDADAAIPWRRIDATTFERQVTENGKVVATRTIRLSSDRKFTQQTKTTRADGRRTVITGTFQREGNGVGLVGRWKLVSAKSSVPSEWHIERNGADGIKLFSEGGSGFAAALDGTPVAVTGPAASGGAMASARLTADRTLEVIDRQDGTEPGRTLYVISLDGKTMTETQTSNGPNVVSVYIKQ